MTEKVFVDSNVLLYAHDKDAGAKQRRAAERLRKLWETGSGRLSTQVLQEFYVTVTRKLGKPLSESDAAGAANDLCAFDVVEVDKEMVVRSMSLSRTERLSFWDALIVEAARTRRCDRLLTEDLHDGRQFGPLKITNPFRDPTASPL